MLRVGCLVTNQEVYNQDFNFQHLTKIQPTLSFSQKKRYTKAVLTRSLQVVVFKSVMKF